MVQKTDLLVIGASGFIGKNLLLSLTKQKGRNIEIYITYRDVEFEDFLATNHLVNQNNVHTVNFEGRDLGAVTKEYDECIYLAPFMSEKFASGYKGRRLIYFSSGAVYMQPTIEYAKSKLQSESLLHQSAGKNIIVRFFGAYGPHELKRKLTRKLLEAWINSEGRFTIYGDGNNFIDAMYVSDAVDSILAILQKPDVQGTFDLCSGEYRTINQWVEDIAQILKWDVKIKHTETNPEEYIKFYGSNQPFKDAFSFIPNISLQRGVMEYLRWLKR